MAQFKKEYSFDKKIKSICVSITGDTFGRFFVDGKYINRFPVCSGGDFLLRGKMSKYYYNDYDIDVNDTSFNILAEIYLSPQVLTDLSFGHGGLISKITVRFDDNSEAIVRTDNTWLARIKTEYISFSEIDCTKEENDWTYAVETDNIWNPIKAPIKPLYEYEKLLEKTVGNTVIKSGEKADITVFFDRIYAGNISFSVSALSCCKISIDVFEMIDGEHKTDCDIFLDKKYKYHGLRMQSVGGYTLHVDNCGNDDVIISDIKLLCCNYPVTDEGHFICSDNKLNETYNVAKHTLEICRQSIHLDSPLHQEFLACTGDYYIESLMEYYAFGDTELATFDIARTADFLRMNGGRMFHTTYSLIWVQMMYDNYMYTGDIRVLTDNFDALKLLFSRFETYIGENGVIDNPPDYMFVDWEEIDGYTLHHPPKALGQTVLNAFYYNALKTAACICDVISENEYKLYCTEKSDELRRNINILFFDSDKEMYFDGLNDKYTPSEWLPENTDKRYYSKQSNILCALFGICDKDIARSILTKVALDKWEYDIQPYFMHFFLEALYNNGMFEEFGPAQLHRYDKIIAKCNKGLAEGWGEFVGDFSHAWGGTPVYQLPNKLLGLEMVKPGYKKIVLKPRLYGLDSADIDVPTPYGHIKCILKKGSEPIVIVPDGIEYTIKK